MTRSEDYIEINTDKRLDELDLKPGKYMINGLPWIVVDRYELPKEELLPRVITEAVTRGDTLKVYRHEGGYVAEVTNAGGYPMAARKGDTPIVAILNLTKEV